MTLQTFSPAIRFVCERTATSRLETLRKYISNHYTIWKNERDRKANLRFVMSLDPIVLRDLGFNRKEIAARHDGPLPISRWKSQKPLD